MRLTNCEVCGRPGADTTRRRMIAEFDTVLNGPRYTSDAAHTACLVRAWDFRN